MPVAGAGLALEVDHHRVVQHLVRQLHNRVRHGRAEEQRLPLRWNVPEYPADVGEKSHVEHAIGFIEHEILEAAELRVRLPEVIEQPPRRADDDVDTAAEGVLLRSHADAAVDGRRR